MATTYWWYTQDTGWTSSANWYTDLGHTTPAESIPQPGDDVVLLGPVGPVINLDDGTFNVPASIDGSGLTDEAILEITSVDGTNMAGADMTITGDVKLTGNAQLSNVTITGNLYQYDSSQTDPDISVTVEGNAYGFDHAQVNIWCNGNYVGRGYGFTSGQLRGNADYYYPAYNNYADVYGDFTYHLPGAKTNFLNFGTYRNPQMANDTASFGGNVYYVAPPGGNPQPI